MAARAGFVGVVVMAVLLGLLPASGSPNFQGNVASGLWGVPPESQEPRLLDLALHHLLLL